MISKGFYTNTGNGIKNTSIQINVQKGILNVETDLFSRHTNPHTEDSCSCGMSSTPQDNYDVLPQCDTESDVMSGHNTIPPV